VRRPRRSTAANRTSSGVSMASASGSMSLTSSQSMNARKALPCSGATSSAPLPRPTARHGRDLARRDDDAVWTGAQAAGRMLITQDRAVHLLRRARLPHARHPARRFRRVESRVGRTVCFCVSSHPIAGHPATQWSLTDQRKVADRSNSSVAARAHVHRLLTGRRDGTWRSQHVLFS
jgi:hypothetical protein